MGEQISRVLIVEDSPTQIEKLRIDLSTEGFEVIAAKSGEEALHILGQNVVDAIVSDVVMPGVSGFDLCKRVKRDSKWENIPFILLTAQQSAMDIVSGLEAGADGFLTKPYEPQGLIRRLRSLIRNSEWEETEKFRMGVQLSFFGKEFTITAAKAQILNLLISTLEDIQRTNDKLKQSQTQLAIARDRAESALLAKSAFLATMSHEIRTPMNAVKGMLELLNKSRLDQDQHDMLNVAYDSAESLLRVIDDILDFSKIEAGKLDIKLQEYSLRTIVEGTADLMTANPFRGKLDILVFVDPDLDGTFRCDGGRIKQILTNLIGNAIKFTDTGWTIVNVTPESRKDGVESILFSVTDTGAGIPEDSAKTLFKPYSQVQTSGSPHPGGTGLGLAICKNLVEMMGGDIGVESMPGKGSTFWFRLTLERVSSAPTKAARSLSGLRTLAVRANKQRRFILSRYLEWAGATTDVVYSIEEAMETLLEAEKTGAPFDIIFLRSEFMTRWEAKFKESPSLQDKIGNIPVVLLGYHKSTAIAEASKEERFAWFLSWPIHFHDLFHCVAKLCNREAPPLTSQLPSAPQTQFIEAPTVETAAKEGIVVLVAEDNRMNRVVIGRQLAHLGYAVEFASDGQEAYNMWDKDRSRYGLLLTDRLMPVMDGFELSQRVRSKESEIGLQRMPILMLTADVSKKLAERAALIGIDEYLRKPTDLETLGTILLKWLPKAAALSAGKPLI